MPDVDLMPRWKRLVDRNPGPAYLSIVLALEDSLRQRLLQDGDRLPPQRQIARMLGVDLTTVTRGFSEARRRGLIEATVGRGTFIKTGAGDAGWRDTQGAIIDLTMNIPPVPDSPSLENLIQSDMRALLRKSDSGALLSYRVTGGTVEERRLGADWVNPLVGARKEGLVLIVPGAQAAIAAVVSTLTSPGDTILTDRFTYPGIRAAAAQFGLIIKGVEGDAEGMMPDAMDDVCRRYAPKLIYCTPTVQNPSTATMSVQRREAILAVARQHRLFLLEDDPYGLLLRDPLPALAQLDPSRVFYISSLSKVISPGLRLAYLVVPSMEAGYRMTSAIRALSLASSGLMTSLATRWIQNGSAGAILSAIQTELRERQAIALGILGGGHGMHPDGPHVWLKLPEWWESAEFVSHARKQGLGLVPGSVFAVEHEPPRRVRIALGSASSRESLEPSLRRVADLLVHRREYGFGAVV
mgnify:CR=1 FL=1